MTEILSLLIEYFPILCGIIATQTALLYIEFYDEANGYMLLAARKLWSFLSLLFGLEWVAAALIYHGLSDKFSSFPRPLLALTSGIFIAAIPNILEMILLPEQAGIRQVQRGAAKFLRKLNLAIRLKFARAIEYQREQDNIDCQSKGGWGLNLNKEQIGRRLRIIYEIDKVEIAKKRKDPEFLRYDTGRTPWEKFYILVKHMGRKRLRYCIANPPNSPGDDWDGRARRKTRGTKADRNAELDRNPAASRIYDDEEYMKRIKAGDRQLEGPKLKEAVKDHGSVD